MELEHSFTVPVPVEQAWTVLLDVERVAPCMPGATLDSVEGDTFGGRVKVKVGPIAVTYRGQARFTEKDEDRRRVVITASGRESRGSGTAAATIRAALTGAGGSTEVRVATELTITGRPAQFGRGVMTEVGNKIIGQFTACLESQIRAPIPAPAAPAEPDASPAATDARSDAPAAVAETPGIGAGSPAPELVTVPAPRRSAEAVDLLGVAGAPLAKRVAPVAAALVAIGILVAIGRRRRGF
jgi:uncharacterized protein